VLQCVAVCCSALQCVVVCCSVLQCMAVQTRVEPLIPASFRPLCRYVCVLCVLCVLRVLCVLCVLCVVVCCSMLQCVAVHTEWNY